MKVFDWLNENGNDTLKTSIVIGFLFLSIVGSAYIDSILP